MTRVFGFVRTSPNTSNDGSLQETKIIIFSKLLIDVGIITNFAIGNNRVGIFHDDGATQTKLRDSNIVGGLFMAINSSPIDEQIFVLILQLDHLGTDEEEISWFLDAIHDIHPNITIHSISEFGLDLYNIAWALLFYHASKCSTRKELGEETKKMVKEDVDQGEKVNLQKAVVRAADLMLETWNRELPNKVKKIVTHKMDHSPGKITLAHAILESNERISNNDDINTIVDDMLRALNAPINAKNEDEILIYVRTSPGKTLTTITSEEGVPLNQVAICMAASEHVLKEGTIRSIICDAEVHNYIVRRDGTLTLFYELIYVSAKHLVIKTMDRISREISPLWHLLIGLCKRGIDTNRLDRRTKNATALTSYKDYINLMYSKMENGKREFAKQVVSWALAITGDN